MGVGWFFWGGLWGGEAIRARVRVPKPGRQANACFDSLADGRFAVVAADEQRGLKCVRDSRWSLLKSVLI